jgi:hypothetical protein
VGDAVAEEAGSVGVELAAEVVAAEAVTTGVVADADDVMGAGVGA